MNDKRKALLLRIAPDLWEALNGWAKDDLRSLNAQIEFILRDAVRRRGRARRDDTQPAPDPRPSSPFRRNDKLL